MRKQGRVFKPTKGSAWWLDFTIDKRRYRQSSETSDYDEALRILGQRRRAAETGAVVQAPSPTRLAAFVEHHVAKKTEGRRFTPAWLRAVAAYLARAVEFFGPERQLA